MRHSSAESMAGAACLLFRRLSGSQVRVSTYLSISFLIYLSVYIYNQFVSLSLSISICFTCPSVYIYLSTYLSICLYLSLPTYLSPVCFEGPKARDKPPDKSSHRFGTCPNHSETTRKPLRNRSNHTGITRREVLSREGRFAA